MKNSLQSVHPELVLEWSEKNLPLTPDKITFGSNKKVWWKGACGHEWQTSVKARSSGEKCPICSGSRVVEGINDLASLKPLLAREWSEKNYPLKPSDVNYKSRRNVWWRCKICGNEWKSVISARVKGAVSAIYPGQRRTTVATDMLMLLNFQLHRHKNMDGKAMEIRSMSLMF